MTRRIKSPAHSVKGMRPERRTKHLGVLTVGWLVFQAMPQGLRAGENVPHAPFAQWADVPERGQFVAGVSYQESEAYHIWAGNTYHNVTVKAGGESYGIDSTQGYLTFQYGITERWAADMSIGYGTVGWRYFANGAPSGTVQSTSGLLDTSLGVRYQILKEGPGQSAWVPTLTFRAGGVLPGTYSKSFAFPPGDRSVAIEPELLLRKHFGWTGLGFYADGLFRWNKTSHNDHYILSAGFFQQIKNWEVQAGYRRLGTVTGENIVLNPDNSVYYPREVRENNHAIEAGFNYTTTKQRIQMGFHTRTVVDGVNTDSKFWVGGYANFPFGLTPKK